MLKILSYEIQYAISTHSKFCIIGGGTGGLSVSAHLLKQKILPTDIRLFDPNPNHYYQPGWTMVGSNLCKSELTFKPMEQVIPEGINYHKDSIISVDASNSLVTTNKSQQFTYDHLIVCSGFQLNWNRIEGAQQALDDPQSPVCSIYSLNYAEKTSRIAQKFKRGNAIFTEPLPPIKCAGAPQKILYLWTDYWQNNKIQLSVKYIKAGGVMFSVPKYSQALSKIAENYNIAVHLKQNLIQIKGKVATFQDLTNNTRVQNQFDFLHLVPPMSPHKYIAKSGLGDQNGYLAINKYTLRHDKFSNIWGLGDCTNLPTSKTAAAIFSQNIVLINNLMAAVRNSQKSILPSHYEGYSSCPLFVGKKKLMLAEFKYDGEIDETFYSDQEKPRQLFYYLKKYLFPHFYWFFVPKGLWHGRKGVRL